MTVTTVTSPEFERNLTHAKRMAEQDPVFIADGRGPTHVLLSIATYRRLAGQRRRLAGALSMPGLADIDLDREIARPRDYPRADIR